MDVPRALAIAAPLPGEEGDAEDILSAGQDIAAREGMRAGAEVIRGRETVDTLVKYVNQHNIDLVVLGFRPDELRGLTQGLCRELYQRVPCAVLVDYIPAEC
jgi:nucleotide-binding universal stress UspA family protein